MADAFGLEPLRLPKLEDETETEAAAHHTAGAAFRLYTSLKVSGFTDDQALQLVGMMMQYTEKQ